ncbi:MAG: hypothetical protein EAX96_09510 [Candidatus Lokiarchaeota archaeon]|nr:hypothetical protein [Candidatus Lokiarchaeota archaeon]
MVFNKSVFLGEILRNFQAKSPTKASAIVSKEGLLIASIQDTDFNEELIAGMAADMLVLGEKTTYEILDSHPDKIIIESKKGTIILIPAGNEAVFFSVINGKNLGLVLFNMRVAAEKTKKILDGT